MRKIGLMMAATMAATMMGAAANATTLSYTFSPDSMLNFVGIADYAVSGGFDYNDATGAISDVTYTTTGTFGTFVFDSGYANSPSDIVFSDGSEEDELFFATSLANGGVDPITGGAYVGYDGDVTASGSAVSPTSVSAAPEPSVWALMLAGVAMIGLTLRQGRRQRGAAMA